MKRFLKSALAVIAFSPTLTQLANANPTNGNLDLIEPGLIMNQSNDGATACSNAFSTASAAEITGCLQIGLGPAIENNHNNIINNNSLIETNSTSLNSLKTLIHEDSDGNIHIGENSFVIGSDVLNSVHPIWAEDENGTKIPLNIYGSDLQINGVSVQGQIDTNESNINKLGEGVAGSTALTAALSALPQLSKDARTTCGVGTGSYSSKFAFGFGCASKINERVDINAGGSYVLGGSKNYGGGTLDNTVLKAGFVFKLGELNKPIQISFKDKKIMKNKIASLEKNNDELKAKNNEIILQNHKLLARLENLEKLTLALKLNNDAKVISMAK